MLKSHYATSSTLFQALIIFRAGFSKNCSYEIVEIITHILILSFCSGSIPNQWRSALVTLIHKVPKPVDFSDYRPISVTPLLSRVAEKLLVANWLRPAI